MMNEYARVKISGGRDMSESESNPSSSPLSFVGWLTLFACLGGFFAVYYGSSLIDPVPMIWNVEGCAIGLFLGILLVYFAPPFKAIGMYLLVPVVFALSGAAATEPLVEFGLFGGLKPKMSQTIAPIVGDWIHNGKRFSYCKGLEVQPFSGSRTVNIRTDRNACDIVAQTASEGPRCILIDVQTGRHGFRRVYAPPFANYGSDRIRSCA